LEGELTKGTVFNIKRYSIHDGPGIRTTVFLKGCPLRCVWCHNPEGIQPGLSFFYDAKHCLNCLSCVRICPQECIVIKKSLQIDLDRCVHCDACVKVCPTNALSKNGVIYTTEELMGVILKDVAFYDESGGGVTFSGGEPLYQFEFLLEMLKKCKTNGIHTTVDTSGFCSPDKIQQIKDYTDLFLYDIKFSDDHLHIKYTGVSNASIKENLAYLISQGKKIWIRIPVIPGLNNKDEHVKGIIEWLKTSGYNGRVHLLAYHDLSSVKEKKMLEYRDQNRADSSIDRQKMNIEYIREKFLAQGFEVMIGG